MSFETPNLAFFKRELQEKFPGLKVGTYNRRPIARSSTWSQHSWPNAGDLYFTRYGDTSPAHQAKLQKVYEWILYKRRTDPRWAQASRKLLWRVRDHWDHIHWDWWPEGYGTPSRIRGGSDNRYRHRSGLVITQAQLTREEEEMLQRGDTGEAVGRFQEWLIAAGYELPEYGPDKDFGGETEAAVRAFQEDHDLEPTGKIGAITAALLNPAGERGPRGPRGPRGADGATPDLSKYRLELVD